MPVGQWRFDARISELPGLQRVVMEFARRNRMSGKVGREMALVVEEWFVNVVHHGLQGNLSPLVEVTLKLEGGWLFIQLRDNGIPFDPWQVPVPDTSSFLDERAIGGLGIHMIRSIMDRVGYSREEGCNLIRLAKRIDGNR